MISSLETLGLRVESVYPKVFSKNVNTNSNITVTFNSELNTDTIIRSVLLLEDKKKSYIKSNKITVDDYKIINTTITYKDKKVIIWPSQLEADCRYIIFINKDNIHDIFNNVMLTDYISYFDTADSSYIECSVIEPANNTVLNKLSKVILSDSSSNKYMIQISKNQSFENTVYEALAEGNKIEYEISLEDGLYYIRAKREDSKEYGEYNVFSIKSYNKTSVTDEDLDEDYVFQEIKDDELKILSSYPENNESLVNVKSNCAYMKFNNIIQEDEIDFSESGLFGSFIDSDDAYYEERLDINQKEDADIDGHFTTIYDEALEKTHIFFVPHAL